VIGGYSKMCDFLISHLYSNYFMKMDDVRYGRCRDNLRGQKEMCIELSRNNSHEVSWAQCHVLGIFALFSFFPLKCYDPIFGYITYTAVF
jgi:hypothetical protein